MKKNRSVLTAAILAISLAASTGISAIPAAAAEMSETETQAAALRSDIEQLEKAIKDLETDQTNCALEIERFEIGIENNDQNYLWSEDGMYAVFADEAAAAYLEQQNAAGDACNALEADCIAASDVLENAKKADADAESVREELAALLTNADGETVTAEEKTAANAARMETIDEEAAALEGSLLTAADDEKAAIEEAIANLRAEYASLKAENEAIAKDAALIKDVEEALAAAQARLDELKSLYEEQVETYWSIFKAREARENEVMKEAAKKLILQLQKKIEDDEQEITNIKPQLLAKQEELARLEAEIRAQIRFSDVAAPEKWYYDAVYWAVRNGVTSGYGEGTFQPDARLTRAQTVTFLYKMAGHPDVSALDAPDFMDVKEGKWYYDAVKWAVANGITTGYGKGTFQPDAACSRAMIVNFIKRYARLNGVYTEPEDKAAFTDVKDTDWFADAVSWAVANGITSGYGEGTFQPNVPCTRAMMVQFLKNYSDMANVA